MTKNQVIRRMAFHKMVLEKMSFSKLNEEKKSRYKYHLDMYWTYEEILKGGK